MWPRYPNVRGALDLVLSNLILPNIAPPPFQGQLNEQPVQLVVPIATSKQSQALQQLQLQYVIIFRFHLVRNQRHLVILRSSISIVTLTMLTSKYPSP